MIHPSPVSDSTDAPKTIAIVGGAGVFGSRLAHLLVRDGHRVVIVGRDPDKTTKAAEALGATAVVIDIQATPHALFAHAPDIVIDAAGPFHAYGAAGRDRYALPRACIAHHTPYLDLCDDAGFATGMGALDAEARAAGCWVLSGASSVPGLSSSVVAALAEGLDSIALIDTAIVPGNRAPRGGAVVASILEQMGRPLTLWRGGQWRTGRTWQEARPIQLDAHTRRTARTIAVPDTTLFPAHFGARSVVFRAGMELGVLNAALTAIAGSRRLVRWAITPARLRALQRIAACTERWGSDRGGMRVDVVGHKAGYPIQRSWTLLAEAGEGPFVPAATARALVRHAHAIPPGARPCLHALPLATIEAAMADLAVATARDERPAPPLFARILQDRWERLAPQAQALHTVYDTEAFTGQAQVLRGHTLLGRLAARLTGFPPTTPATRVQVEKQRTPQGETWIRTFGTARFHSHCSAGTRPYTMRERFGPLVFEIDLPVEEGVMRLPVRRGWCLGLPIPRWLLPLSESREYVQDGRFHFDVAISLPLSLGLITHYQGWLEPDVPIPDTPQRPAQDTVGA